MIVCTALLLIVTEVDLGTTALIGATMFAVMFVAGTHPALLGILSLGGLGGILFVATHMSERMARLAAFMDPERFKDDAGLHNGECAADTQPLPSSEWDIGVGRPPLGLPWADGDGMGRLPPQPPANSTRRQASILEPEVPRRRQGFIKNQPEN